MVPMELNNQLSLTIARFSASFLTYVLDLEESNVYLAPMIKGSKGVALNVSVLKNSDIMGLNISMLSIT